jgi:SulP family sulfate permease
LNKYNEFFNNLSTSFVVAFYLVFNSIICSSIMFAKSNSDFMFLSLSLMIVGSIVVNFFYYKSSHHSFISSCTSPFLCVILAEIISKILKNSTNTDSHLPTILAIFLISGLFSSFFMYIIGKLKLSHLIRFLPLPVIGGLILGFGIFIIGDSFHVISNNVPLNFKHYSIPIYIIYLLFTISILILGVTFKSKVLPPLFLIVTLLGINLLSYIYPDSDFINSLFFKSSENISLVATDSNIINMIFLVDYLSIYENIHLFVVFGILSVIQYLFVSSVMEMQYNEKIDVDNHIKLTSKAITLASIIFCPISIPNAGSIALTYTLMPSKKYFKLLVCMFLLLFLIFLKTVLYSIPYFFLATMPVLIGLQLLKEWLFDSFKSMPKSEYIITVVIAFAFLLLGSVQAAIVGVVISSFFFIIKYSQSKTIRYHITGNLYKSNFVRPLKHVNYLNKYGHQIHIYKVQGYLFFGSTKILAEKITKSLDESSGVKYIIIDFSLVTSIDISGISFLIQLHKNASNNNVEIFITNSTSEIKSMILKKSKNYNMSNSFLSSLDEGLEKCEDYLIEHAPDVVRNIGKEDAISSLIESKEMYNIFKKYLLSKIIKRGELLFEKGEDSDSIAFVKKGLIGVYIKIGDKKERVMKSGAGTIIGDIGFFLNISRTADVVAETDLEVFYLTIDSYNDLCEKHPKISLLFSSAIIKQQARNITNTNEKVNMLL